MGRELEDALQKIEQLEQSQPKCEIVDLDVNFHVLFWFVDLNELSSVCRAVRRPSLLEVPLNRTQVSRS